MGECEGVHIEGALSAKITRSSLCYHSEICAGGMYNKKAGVIKHQPFQ